MTCGWGGDYIICLSKAMPRQRRGRLIVMIRVKRSGVEDVVMNKVIEVIVLRVGER